MFVTPISALREELRDWLMEQRDTSQARTKIEEIAGREADYLGDSEAVNQVLKAYDLWNNELPRDIVSNGESLYDISRYVIQDHIEEELGEELDDFKDECESGDLQWCDNGYHWRKDHDSAQCQDCGTTDCEEHGDVSFRDDVEDEDGYTDQRELCESCYRETLRLMDKWATQRKDNQVEREAEREQEREAEREAEGRFERE